ncbi:MAG: efflux RND transporter permease subunit [Cytophagales bacterium]
MFWSNLANFVLRNKLTLLIIIALITIFMAWSARSLEISYDYLRIIPQNDPDLAYYQEFREKFGEDGNLVVVGIDDKKIRELSNFKEYQLACNKISAIEGINDILAFPKLKELKRNDSLEKFEFINIFPTQVSSQKELDTLIDKAYNQKIYEGQLFNQNNDALLIAISVNKNYANSKKRQEITSKIVEAFSHFNKKTNIQVHYSGIPYIRSIMTTEVSSELKIFLVLSIAISGIILFFFFRSWDAFIVPNILVLVVVVWTFGTIALLGYNITMLTGLIPSLMVVTGIPNFIYLINKYHQEYYKYKNKVLAISRIIKSIGVVTLMVNATTAVGFLVLANNDVTMLKEFGIVSGINIMLAFFISIILVPAVLMYLPAPTEKKLEHLKRSSMNNFLEWSLKIAQNNKTTNYVVTGLICLVSFWGIYKIKTVSFMVDDVPTSMSIVSDLKFFEEKFKGIMPYEIVINFKNKKKLERSLKKIEELSQNLSKHKEISTPISITTLLKGTYQAYNYGDKNSYFLPGLMDPFYKSAYLKSGNSSNAKLVRSFVDSTSTYVRISCKVADLGSIKIDSLSNNVIKPLVNQYFPEDKYEVKYTGTTLLFTKGNNLLISSLYSSIVQSILFNAFLMAFLFTSVRMILITLVQNLIPLFITAGIMGFFGIPLKPSTAIIFSIVFGITVDNTIHFLAKYRYEIFNNKKSKDEALKLSILDAGPSIIYTSIVLFFGFLIFAFSSFGGTQALGVLTSITLFTAMITSFTILPVLILSFDRGKNEKDYEGITDEYEGDSDENTGKIVSKVTV